MERILLFDGNCPACSPLARAVERLGVPGLTARSLHDTDVLARVGRAGLTLPAEPALLCDDGERVRLLTGNRLRLHLVRLLGVRRGREIIRLAALEALARRRRAGGDGAPSRRKVLGATAGAAAGLTLIGSAQPAAADPPGGGTAPADPRKVRELLGQTKVRQAVDTFGPADIDSAFEVSGGDEPIIAIVHDKSTAITFVGMAPGKEQLVIAMRPLPSAKGLEFLTAAGESLCTLTMADGKVKARPPEVQPLGIPWSKIACYYLCLGWEVTETCVTNCWDCINGGLWTKAIKCPLCTACGGLSAIRCARQCLFD